MFVNKDSLEAFDAVSINDVVQSTTGVKHFYFCTDATNSCWQIFHDVLKQSQVI